MEIKVDYIQHCDDENCSMGTAEWTCPACDKHNIDYGDLFYDEHEKNSNLVLECEHCKCEWIITKTEYGIYIIK